jgi:hypothetical protein
MSWIFEHIQLVVVIGGAIAYWINQRAREKTGQAADYDADGVPERRSTGRQPGEPASVNQVPGATTDADERVRRIQEEIRRKIAERRGHAAPSPAATTVSTPQPLRRVHGEGAPSMPPVIREVVYNYDDKAALERQRKLAEQMEALESKRRAAQRLAQLESESGRSAVAASTAYAIGRPHVAEPGGVRESLASDLRSPQVLRRAMVLREVLGPPVALR